MSVAQPECQYLNSKRRHLAGPAYGPTGALAGAVRSHWPSAILPHPTVLAVQPLEAYPHVSPTTTSGLALTLGGRPPPIVKPTSFLRALYRSLNESLTSTLAVSRSDLAGFESTDANDISVSRSSTARSEWRFLVLLC